MVSWAQSPAFTLGEGVQSGQFRIESPGRALTGVAGVEVVRGRHAFFLSTDALLLGEQEHYPIADSQGAGEELAFYYQEVHGVALSLRFRIYPARPFILLRISVTHVGPGERRENGPLMVRRFFFRTMPGELRPVAPAVGCYVNGWASHSPAGYRSADESIPPLGWRWLEPSGSRNCLTPDNGGVGRFWSETVGALVTSREALVAGGVSLADQFVQLGVDLRPNHGALLLQSQADEVALAPGEALASEWFYLEWVAFPNPDPLAQYASAVTRQMGASIALPASGGWCSCSTGRNRASEAGTMENLAAAAALADSLPLQVILLDRGYELVWGDWAEWNARTFPHGPAWLARRIAGSHFVPGLGLSPFVLQPRAKPARAHADWLLKDERGQPVSTGVFSGPRAWVLDPTHPEVEEHLRQLMTTVVEKWGYRYLRLDWLYAAALPGRRHNPHLTRAQAYRQALRVVRDVTRGAFLVGGRAPLGPSLGLVDAMRSGPEPTPVWEPELERVHFFVRGHPALPALRNSLRNVMARAWMHGRWWINDPDCLTAREDAGAGLSAEFLAQVTLLGLCGGQLFLSDDLSRLSGERQSAIAALLPPLVEGADVQDLFRHRMPEIVTAPMARAWGHWWLVGLFNWSDGPIDRALPGDLPGLNPRQAHHLMDFWGRRYLRLEAGMAYPVYSLPPHGGILLGIRTVRTMPQLVGTTFHISQGGEVSAWQAEPGRVSLTVGLGRAAEGEIWLALPSRPLRARVEGTELPPGAVRAIAPGVWSIGVRLFKAGTVEVDYG